MRKALAGAAVLLSFLAGCATKGVHEGHGGPATAAAATGREAPLFDDLGNHHHAISTKSPEAQRYFDQGLVLAWGFNHAEAGRAFREAARLDPDCAMCWWGASLVLGPNINATMEDGAVPDAWEALEKAVALAPKASEAERAYIQALSKRYVAKPVKDRKSLDAAYADAMREVMRRYPDDLDAAALFADAVAHLTKAAALEDELIYQEPPDWYAPARQALGATLAGARRWADAEAAYRDDLARNRENGWSLRGLAAALDAQGRKEEAEEVRKRFEKAWPLADVRVAAF